MLLIEAFFLPSFAAPAVGVLLPASSLALLILRVCLFRLYTAGLLRPLRSSSCGSVCSGSTLRDLLTPTVYRGFLPLSPWLAVLPIQCRTLFRRPSPCFAHCPPHPPSPRLFMFNTAGSPIAFTVFGSLLPLFYLWATPEPPSPPLYEMSLSLPRLLSRSPSSSPCW